MSLTLTRRLASSQPSRTVMRFLTWWRSELGALIPTKVRQWWDGVDNLLLLSIDDEHGLVEQLTPKGLEELISFDLSASSGTLQDRPDVRLGKLIGHDFRLLLALPSGKVLRRTVSLPLAIEENLRESLGFELDRFTPFKSDQAYFDFRVLERDDVRKRLTVELAAVQRTVVDSATNRAATFGLVVSGAVLADQFAANEGCFRFLSETAASVRKSGRRMRRSGIFFLAVTLLAAALAIPIWQKRTAAIALLKPISEAKAEAERTDQLRARLEQMVHAYNFPIDSKWQSPSLLLVLDELSKLLPDDTFVSHLEFDGKGVQIQGESGSAASLVQLLEGSRMFKEVGFKSQLTKIQGTQSDRFHIVAALRDARPQPITGPGSVVTGRSDTAGEQKSGDQQAPGVKP